MCNEYNGYENKPTWIIVLWMLNDDGLYRSALLLAEEADNAFVLAELLHGWFSHDLNPIMDVAGPFSDLLSWSLAIIDWVRVAKQLLEGFDDA